MENQNPLTPYAEPGITREQLIAHALLLLEQPGHPAPQTNPLFLIRTGSQWMREAANEAVRCDGLSGQWSCLVSKCINK